VLIFFKLIIIITTFLLLRFFFMNLRGNVDDIFMKQPASMSELFGDEDLAPMPSSNLLLVFLNRDQIENRVSKPISKVLIWSKK